MTNQTQNGSDWPPKIVACAGAVVLKEKHVLFVRQAKGHALEGQWSIPWGFIDPGESPELAALRETREESGITAEIEGLLGIQNLRHDGWLSIIFLCRHIGGIPTSDGGIETDQAAYFSLEEMESSDQPIEPWCAWLVRRVLEGQNHFIPLELNNPYQPRTSFL